MTNLPSLRICGLVLVVTALGCQAEAVKGGSTNPSASAPATSASGSALARAVSASAETVASAAVDIPPPGTPIVDLGGVVSLPLAPKAGEPALVATKWVVRVYDRPSTKGKTIGFLRAGAIVRGSGEKKPGSSGCREGFVGIAPVGWACLKAVSEDRSLDIATNARPPDYRHRLPYMYGTVTRGGPVYARLPTEKHLKKYEPSLKKHLRKWKDDEVSGATYGLDVWLRHTKSKTVPSALEALKDRVSDDDVPAFVAGGGVLPNVSGRIKSKDSVKVDQVNRRQGRSFVHSFLKDGRRYNVTPDFLVIPADRFRPIRGSSFHGWQVDQELEFPFGLVRRSGASLYQWDAKSKQMKRAKPLEWRSAVALTGKQKLYRKKLYYQTKEGLWTHDRHTSRIDPAKRWPRWAEEGAKWIDVNITKQVLVAYEGKKMVYATIVSTGEAGLGDPEDSTATKRGIFRVHTKWVSATMDSDIVGEEFELRDVPYVQYFEGGYALHGAYWHDSFGRPKSHGCINLAPDDARRLFFWTDPVVPVGWHGVKKNLTGTRIFVHP